MNAECTRGRTEPFRKLLCRTCLGLVLLLPVSGRLQVNPSATSPSRSPSPIRMLEIPGVTADDPSLHRAIQAQLSTSAVQIRSVRITDPADTDPMNTATRLLQHPNVELVFWIRDDGSICSLFFHSLNATGDHVETHVRTLHLESTGRSSRFEVIANAVASVAEGFLQTRALSTEPVTSIEPAGPPISTGIPSRSGHRLELALRWSGTLFADRRFAHGMHVGIGTLPLRYVAIQIAYTHYLPLEWITDEFKITLHLRHIETAAYARLPAGPLEFRVGVSGTVDLRSWSLHARTENITARLPQLQAIYAAGPALSALWMLTARLALDADTGLHFGLNEKSYRILRQDGTKTPVLDPYRVRFTCRLGLSLLL